MNTLRLPSGFTLLEVILALSLTVVVLSLIGMSMKVQESVIKKSSVQVDEAKLARQLVERIANDVRNAVPFKAAAASSDGSTSSSSSGSTTTSGSDSSGSTSTSSSDSTAASATTPLSGGVFGTATALQIESFHRPKVDATLVSTLDDSDEPSKLSDVRSIAYSSGQPVTGDMAQDPESPEGAGLYKRDIERAEFVFGSQNGFAGGGTDTVKLMAPEVTKLSFSYYDGTQFTDTWDSNQQNKLPTAIRVSVSIHLPNKAADGSALAEASTEPTVYDTLIQLPNSNVGPGPVASDGMPPISKITLDQPSKPSGGGREGGRGGRGGEGGGKDGGKNHHHKHDPTKPPGPPEPPVHPIKPPGPPVKPPGPPVKPPGPPVNPPVKPKP